MHLAQVAASASGTQTGGSKPSSTIDNRGMVTLGGATTGGGANKEPPAGSGAWGSSVASAFAAGVGLAGTADASETANKGSGSEEEVGVGVCIREL